MEIVEGAKEIEARETPAPEGEPDGAQETEAPKARHSPQEARGKRLWRGAKRHARRSFARGATDASAKGPTQGKAEGFEDGKQKSEGTRGAVISARGAAPDGAQRRDAARYF